MLQKQNVHDVLGEDGLLAGADNFNFREQQLVMAEAVEECIAENRKLIVEAGTGTGKTFAYLVPAILSGKKIIISTATKNLQDQLFHKDLPIIRELLASGCKIAHLKGRSNYLCIHRLENHLRDGRLQSLDAVQDLQRAANWVKITKTGDLADMPDIADDSSARPYITSTGDNCLGAECPDFADCFLAKARRRAQSADILIINHHLFFADCALKDNGFGELLPNFDAVIFDEAHNLSEVASNFFGINLSSRQLFVLARDVENEYIKNGFDLVAVKDLIERVKTAVSKMHSAIGNGQNRAAWNIIAAKPALQTAITELKETFGSLVALLEQAAGRSKEVERCWSRGDELLYTLNLVTEKNGSEYIHWYETTRLGFNITLTPLNIAERFQSVLEAEQRAWIFTSATLAVNGDFNHFQSGLGLGAAQTLLLASPFNYKEQALFYVPRDLPDPRASNYLRALIDVAVPVIDACKGRTFFLFTSHRMLQEASNLLHVYLDYPLLVQGQMPKRALLAEFTRLDNAVLLGTNSFWEGVDVRGEKLSCVIIDKLPFAVPDDPVIKARTDALRAQGKNAFYEYQLPQAVISLKQGAGRLIRDETDTGVLMICDPRLIEKSYGKVFIRSLPAMRKTRDLNVIREFFNE